jgi:hypothetical protein
LWNFILVLHVLSLSTYPQLHCMWVCFFIRLFLYFKICRKLPRLTGAVHLLDFFIHFVLKNSQFFIDILRT